MTRRQCLDGEWEFLPQDDAAAPTAATPELPGGPFAPEPICVPGYWNVFPDDCGGDWGAYDNFKTPPAWRKATAGWYRLRFRREHPIQPGDRVRLVFDAVAGATTVWLDGVRLGENIDSFLPFRFDVTEPLRIDREHEILVRVDPPYRDGDLWRQPCGSWVGWHLRGIWQSVHVDTVPGLAVRDVFAQPSVRNGSLDVDIIVEGAGSDIAELLVQVEESGRVVKDLGKQPVPPGDQGEVTLRFRDSWPDARFWSPDDPHLYHVHARLQTATGVLLHEKTIRFGFREFWIDGTGFRLNGQPIRLFGDSWHYMGAAQQNPAYARAWFELAFKTGANAIRTHAMPYPPFYFDVADEVGMLIIDESAVYGSAGTLSYGDRRFWDHCRDHVRRLVRRDRNHPSIIFWSACNETVWKGGDRIFDDLLSLADEAAALDPTRFVSFDENDCDLGGRAPLHVGHYGTPGHWRRSWQRDRPLAIHEFCSLYHGGPDSACPIGDDRVYADYLARLEAAGIDAADMFLALRSLGAASITPWNINWYCLEPMPSEAIEAIPAALTKGGAAIRRIGARSLTLNYGYAPDDPPWRPNPAYAPLADCYKRQRFHVRCRPRQGFAGQELNVELEVWNDRPDRADLVVALHAARDTSPVAAEREIRLDAGASTQVILPFKLLAVDRLQAQTVGVRLSTASGGAVLHSESWTVYVHPPADADPGKHRAVWVAGDREYATRIAERWGGRAIQAASTPADLLSDTSATLVLARGHGGRTVRDWLDNDGVEAWMRRGGRILVLPDGAADDPASSLTPIRRAYDHAYPRADGDDLLRGLTAEHFRDWQPKGDVAAMVFQRPETGPAAAVLDVGDVAEGLAYSPLIITGLGDGHVVVCGLPLAERFVDTPAAAVLLGRLLHERLPLAKPVHDLTLIESEDEHDRSLFAECGLCAAEAGEVLWCEGGAAAVLQDSRLSRQGIDAWLASGRTIVIDGLTPETAPSWSDRLGVPLHVAPDVRFNVARCADSDIPCGINNYDLCWVNRDDKQPITRFTLDLDPSAYDTLVQTVATRWEDYQFTAEQSKVAMMYRRLESFPGPRAAVVEFRRGPGRVVINQLLMREAQGRFRSRGRRLLSRWLDTLGVTRADVVNPLHPRERRVVTADGYITDWLVLGPFVGGEGHPLDHPFVDEAQLRPDEGVSDGGCSWRRIASAFPQIDLGTAFEVLPERDRVAYAAIRVYAPLDRSVLLDAPDMITLLAGADGGTKAFLNGAELGRFDFVRELVLDSDRVDGVPLGKGWNTLVLKLHNPSGPWRFAARFLTAAGEPAGDLEYRLVPPG